MPELGTSFLQRTEILVVVRQSFVSCPKVAGAVVSCCPSLSFVVSCVRWPRCFAKTVGYSFGCSKTSCPRSDHCVGDFVVGFAMSAMIGCVASLVERFAVVDFGGVEPDGLAIVQQK